MDNAIEEVDRLISGPAADAHAVSRFALEIAEKAHTPDDMSFLIKNLSNDELRLLRNLLQKSLGGQGSST